MGAYLLIQDEAGRYVNDPTFGLHMGEFAEAGSWSILGYMMMNGSVRTLQKRLEAEGVIFSELVGEIRQKLANQHLLQDYSVEQITYLLGFSEPSVFRKSFKKWEGITPKEFRSKQLPSAHTA